MVFAAVQETVRMAQVHVLTGPERRRRWSEEQKRALVAAAFAPGAVVSDVARQADVCSSLIYRCAAGRVRRGDRGADRRPPWGRRRTAPSPVTHFRRGRM